MRRRATFPHIAQPVPSHRLSHLKPSGQARPCLTNRVISLLLSKRGVGTSLSSASSGERRGQFSLMLQPVRGRTDSVQPYPPLPFVKSGVLDINTDRGYKPGPERRHGSWQQPRARAGWQSSHASQPTTHGIYFFDMRLSIGNEPSSLSLPQHTVHLLIIVVTDCPVPQLMFSPPSPGRMAPGKHEDLSPCLLRPSRCWAGQHFLLQAPNLRCLNFVGKFPCVDLNFNFASFLSH